METEASASVADVALDTDWNFTFERKTFELIFLVCLHISLEKKFREPKADQQDRNSTVWGRIHIFFLNLLI
jgi:hypothetical protein